eukprot:COSAG04_NODE_172_length_21594_cov_14.638614_8_plen_81_part_00
MGAGLSLTEVDSAEDGSNGHNQRKCTIMFELSINLLRVLEFFTAKYVPSACRSNAASMLHLFKDLVHAAVSSLTYAVADR